jgi:hypothetical protein
MVKHVKSLISKKFRRLVQGLDNTKRNIHLFLYIEILYKAPCANSTIKGINHEKVCIRHYVSCGSLFSVIRLYGK